MAFSFGENQPSVADRPRISSSPPFLLAWAGDWGVIGGRVVPSLIRHGIVSGVNGVLDAEIPRLAGGGRNYHPALATVRRGIERRGQVMLPPDNGPDGEGYIEVHPAARGVAHLAAWDVPVAGADAIRTDEAEYLRWIDHWIAAGLLPSTPQEGAVSARIAELERILDRARTVAGGTDGARFRAYSAELEAWRACVPPAPVAKPAKKKKAPKFQAEAAADDSTPIADDVGFGA